MKVQYYDYIEKVVMQWFLKSVCKKYKVNSYKIWIWSLLQVLTIIFVNWNENSILKLQRIVIPWIFKGIFFSLFCFIVRVNYAFRILNFIWDPQENGLSFFFFRNQLRIRKMKHFRLYSLMIVHVITVLHVSVSISFMT